MEVLGKKYPVHIAARGNAETGQYIFSLRIFSETLPDLPEDGEVYVRLTGSRTMLYVAPAFVNC